MTFGDEYLRAIEAKQDALAAQLGGFVLTEAGQVAAELAKKVEQLEAELAAAKAEVERLAGNGIHTCHDRCPRIACVQRREIAALKSRNERMLDAVNWACGITVGGRTFGEGDSQRGPFWWRRYLCEIAGVIYNGSRYVVFRAEAASHG